MSVNRQPRHQQMDPQHYVHTTSTSKQHFCGWPLFPQECDSPIISPFWAPRPFGRREAGTRGGVGTKAESALFQPWDPGINPPPRYNPIQLGAAPRLTKQRTQREGQHVSQGLHRHVHTPPRNKRQRGRCHLRPCTPTHEPPPPITNNSTSTLLHTASITSRAGKDTHCCKPIGKHIVICMPSWTSLSLSVKGNCRRCSVQDKIITKPTGTKMVHPNFQLQVEILKDKMFNTILILEITHTVLITAT